MRECIAMRARERLCPESRLNGMRNHRLKPSGLRTRASASPPPVLLRFPLYRRRVRVLGLDPVRRAPRTIGRVAPLRHDALEADLARVLEDEWAILLVEMLVE